MCKAAISAEDLKIEARRARLALQVAQRIHDLLVHAGGRVSSEYIRRTAADLSLGELVPLDAAEADKLRVNTHRVANELFLEVSRKFFGKKPDEINRIKLSISPQPGRRA